jgi:hypothetical protein
MRMWQNGVTSIVRGTSGKGDVSRSVLSTFTRVVSDRRVLTGRGV